MGTGESGDFVRSTWYDLDWRGNVGIVGHGNVLLFWNAEQKDWRPTTKNPSPTGEF